MQTPTKPLSQRSLWQSNASAGASSTNSLSKRSTWRDMSERRASRARFDSSSSTSSLNEGSAFQRTIDAILSPSRLAGLDAADVAPIPYDTYSFFSHILSVRGRNLSMVFSPLLLLLCWGVGWQLIFVYTDDNEIHDYLASLQHLVLPILTPLSFLLTFRMGRAAVRFWDARHSVGIIMGVCRANIATVSVGVISPIKANVKQVLQTKTTDDQSIDGESSTQMPGDLKPEEDGSIELLCQYARWLAVFPIAVNHHVRPQTRKGWNQEELYKKYRYEIGTLLSDCDARKVIMTTDNERGLPSLSGGTRVRDSPLVVLNRLHQLAYEIAYYQAYNNDRWSSAPIQAMFYQQITNQLKELTDAYGAMERIKNTPLPFAYAIHLRTFLLLYLFLWNMISVAEYGWVSIPFLSLLNWALLGIEAAAVECESPFEYRENHLALGKVAVLISRNIGQALKELTDETVTAL
ncbi:hypothetical protein ACHAXN_010042 [Cyclotella atomus]